MNAVEIEEAVSALVQQPFEPNEIPFGFLEAFGNKETTSSACGQVHRISQMWAESCKPIISISPFPQPAKSRRHLLLSKEARRQPKRRRNSSSRLTVNTYIRGRKPGKRRNDGLRVSGCARPFWLFPSAGGDHNRQTSQRECLRHQGDRTLEQTLR
jgi:hypothetical protein